MRTNPFDTAPRRDLLGKLLTAAGGIALLLGALALTEAWDAAAEVELANELARRADVLACQNAEQQALERGRTNGRRDALSGLRAAYMQGLADGAEREAARQGLRRGGAVVHTGAVAGGRP